MKKYRQKKKPFLDRVEKWLKRHEALINFVLTVIGFLIALLK